MAPLAQHAAVEHFWACYLQSSGGRIEPVIDPQRRYQYQTDTGQAGIDPELHGRITTLSPNRVKREVWSSAELFYWIIFEIIQ